MAPLVPGRTASAADNFAFSDRTRRLIELDRMLLQAGMPGVLERPPAEVTLLEHRLSETDPIGDGAEEEFEGETYLIGGDAGQPLLRVLVGGRAASA